MKVLPGSNVLNKQSRTKGDPCPRLLTSSHLIRTTRYELLHSVFRVIISTEKKRTVSTRRVSGGLFKKLSWKKLETKA